MKVSRYCLSLKALRKTEYLECLYNKTECQLSKVSSVWQQQTKGMGGVVLLTGSNKEKRKQWLSWKVTYRI